MIRLDLTLSDGTVRTFARETTVDAIRAHVAGMIELAKDEAELLEGINQSGWFPLYDDADVLTDGVPVVRFRGKP